MSEAEIQRIDHPTGFATTGLPFWEKLDDGDFEQFCTDWLNFHPTLLCQRNGKVEKLRVVSASRLLSGTSQRGADIRAELENGEVWYLQCKLVKEFHPSDVRDVIRLAEKQNPGANQHVLITTCGLSDTAQQEIASRAKWVWWDSSRLTTEAQKIDPVESGMKLVHRFFGPAWVKLLFPWGANIFLTWEEYFAQDLSSERRLFHHRGEFLIWGDILARLQSFARESAGRALVLSGGGGQGKSRLLLELAKALETQTDSPRVRFLRIGGRSLGEESLDLIGRETNLVLIIEDAHRLDVALGQVATAAACSDTVRLLIATRPLAREAVTSELVRHGYGERLEPPVNLPRWKQSEVQALAEKVLSPSRQLQAPHLAAIADRCPLLVVLGGALINSGAIPEAMTNETLFRERVFKGFLEEFLEHYEGQRRERLGRLIRLLAFIAPTAKDDSLFTSASEILGCSGLDVADDIEALQGAGLLAENREGIRIYPDLFSDAVLLDACLDGSGQTSLLCRTIVEKFPAADFPALLRNLAQADWETRTKRGAQNSFFDPVWRQFVRCFENANWWDREKMLHHWAPFALFQPERTLELAQLAIGAPQPQHPRDHMETSFGFGDPTYMLRALPTVLKPVVMWHPSFANQALDILWSLKSEQPLQNNRSDASPIGTIASAASFEVQAHPGPESVLAWLENRLAESAFAERINRQPWVLAAVLSPFFARVVEQSWQTGRTITFRAVPLRVEATRPLRQRALALAEKFATSGAPVLARAGIQVLEEATRGIDAKFGYQPGASDYDRWRADRLEAVAVVERAMTANINSHVTLLQIRALLSRRAEHDQDEIVGNVCQELLFKMPDTFELRSARVLTSWSHVEFRIRPGVDFDADLREADRRWDLFCRDVAVEAAERFATAERVCEFLKAEAAELSSAGFMIQPYVFLSAMAMLSAAWSASLLKELSATSDATFDPFLSAVFRAALSKSPDDYRRAIAELPRTGRPGQVGSLVNFFGRKHQHGGGLIPLERASLELCAHRTETQIIQELASTLGLHFSGEAKWAADLLSRLKAQDSRDGHQILRALGQVIENHAELVEPRVVSQCLSNAGAYCLSYDTHEERNLEKIAKRFPLPVYELFRQTVDSAAESESPTLSRITVRGLPALGKFPDSDYVNGEIKVQWVEARAKDLGRGARIALIQALTWSDLASAESRMKEIIVACENGDQLQIAAELCATKGSRFVFQFPCLVRELLSRSADFRVREKILRLLWFSACGGNRSFTENKLDAEYLYIRNDADKLAAEHSTDPLLSPFYKMILESEDRENEMRKGMFPPDEDDLE